jgi:hypothetical protein
LKISEKHDRVSEFMIIVAIIGFVCGYDRIWFLATWSKEDKLRSENPIPDLFSPKFYRELSPFDIIQLIFPDSIIGSQTKRLRKFHRLFNGSLLKLDENSKNVLIWAISFEKNRFIWTSM